MEQTCNDSFQMKLFKQLCKEAAEGENVAYSPISIYILLALLSNGSIKDTQDELLFCLSPDNPTLLHINSLMEKLQEQINGLDCLTIATMLATNEQPYEDFKKICFQYNAEISPLTSVEDINEWASTKTNGMIRRVLDSISNLSFVLINAVYFKGSWVNVFPKGQTHSTNFHSSKGKVSCEMMSQFNIVSAIYGEGDYEAIQLLYSESEDIRAAYIKPIDDSIDTFIEGMTNSKLTKILKKLQQMSYRMRISVPKMTIEGDYDLIPSLQSIGLNQLFKKEAEITKILKAFQGINTISQKCVIKVDEKGTEAAAVTTTTGKHGRPKEISFDSSFIFIIFHKDFPEHFLFIAEVDNPSNE